MVNEGNLMLHKLKTLLRQVMSDGSDSDNYSAEDMNLAMAALLCEVANADHSIRHQEYDAKVHLLEKLLDLDTQQVAKLVEKAQQKAKKSVSLYDFTSQLRSLEFEVRFELIKAMWVVAFADDHLDPLEESVIRQVAELLYVDHAEFIRAKLEVQPK